jgi:hypothetical protein
MLGDHEKRISELEESTTWNRRLIILLCLYGSGGTAILSADQTSDYLATLIKIALKIP